MAHRLEFSDSARRELDDLDKPTRRRVLAKIDALADDPRPPDCKKLVNQKGLWRVRVGTYRVIYEVNDRVVLVFIVAVAHRREAYR